MDKRRSWEGLLSPNSFKGPDGKCPECGHWRQQHTAFGFPIIRGCCGGSGQYGNPDIKDVGKCGCLYHVPVEKRAGKPRSEVELPVEFCPECGHGTWNHAIGGQIGIQAGGCFDDGGNCQCRYYIEQWQKGELDMDEVGKGSPLKKWVCSCRVHLVNAATGQTRSGPYIIRATGTGLQAICQWCEKPFVRADEGLPRKRKSKICGAHCPEGAHDHA